MELHSHEIRDFVTFPVCPSILHRTCGHLLHIAGTNRDTKQVLINIDDFPSGSTHHRLPRRGHSLIAVFVAVTLPVTWRAADGTAGCVDTRNAFKLINTMFGGSSRLRSSSQPQPASGAPLTRSPQRKQRSTGHKRHPISVLQ